MNFLKRSILLMKCWIGVKSVLDTDHLSEDDVLEAEKSGSSVVLKKKKSEKVE